MHSRILHSAHAETSSANPTPRRGAPVVTTDAVPLVDEAPLLIGESSDVFVPEGYEPGYAYPLIIWLQGDDGAERHDFRRVMPVISTRNYLGLKISLRRNAGGDLDGLADRILARYRGLRRERHIHTERVTLVGAGTAGTAALQLVLDHPQWFAGAAALNSPVPARQPLAKYHALRGKRIWLAAGENHPEVAPESVTRAARLLHAAGLRVGVRLYDSADGLPRPMLLDVDRWLMGQILETQPV